MYNNDPRPLSWTDGTPTASSTNNLNGIYIPGVQNGLSFTAPADTSSRTLTAHVSGWLSGGTLTAHLSDGSAADFVDTTPFVNGSYDRNYTLIYKAGTAGQTLTVIWVMNSGSNGNVALQGAALAVESTPPANITATGGTPQNATVNTAFVTALQATVKDGNNNPVIGTTVTFTAPGSGPSGAFGGSPTAMVATDSSGVASAPTFTANGQTGPYSVMASVPGVATQASFSLTNKTGAAASITATGGTPQSTTMNTAFVTALQATVKDANNNPVSGTTVTFTAPGSGPSGAFGGSPTAIVATNGSGIASAPAFTANGQTGPYGVMASVSGLAAQASFSLTNKAVSTTGSLNGSATGSTTPANLTTEGPTDWVHWGDTSLNRKANVPPQISTYTVVGGTAGRYSNDPRPLSWSDGTPTVSSTNNLKGLYIRGVQSGFSFTAPADTTSRTLTVHVGGWRSGGTLTAHLSDGSAADFVDTTPLANGIYDRNYTLSYQATKPLQTLTVTWVMNSGSGNVALQGAALAQH
jgi:hypothetical protein